MNNIPWDEAPRSPFSSSETRCPFFCRSSATMFGLEQFVQCIDEKGRIWVLHSSGRRFKDMMRLLTIYGL